MNVRRIRLIAAGMSFFFLTACGVIKNPIEHRFQLSAFSTDQLALSTSSATLLITPTDAVDGYQTEQMHYLIRPFALKNFTKNNWFSPPATMLYPLLIQSLQRSSYFKAVSSGVYTSKTTYRLDTQLIALQQNFIKKPSVLELKVKAIVTRVDDNQILASHLFRQSISCSEDTPYGGVMAANQATYELTKAITRFVISSI